VFFRLNKKLNYPNTLSESKAQESVYCDASLDISKGIAGVSACSVGF